MMNKHCGPSDMNTATMMRTKAKLQIHLVLLGTTMKKKGNGTARFQSATMKRISSSLVRKSGSVLGMTPPLFVSQRRQLILFSFWKRRSPCGGFPSRSGPWSACQDPTASFHHLCGFNGEVVCQMVWWETTSNNISIKDGLLHISRILLKQREGILFLLSQFLPLFARLNPIKVESNEMMTHFLQFFPVQLFSNIQDLQTIALILDNTRWVMIAMKNEEDEIGWLPWESRWFVHRWKQGERVHTCGKERTPPSPPHSQSFQCHSINTSKKKKLFTDRERDWGIHTWRRAVNAAGLVTDRSISSWWLSFNPAQNMFLKYWLLLPRNALNICWVLLEYLVGRV